MLRRARAITVALTALCCQACNTAFLAHLPRAAEDAAFPEETIDHCLSSLGFEDESQDELSAVSIRKEPELVAVWSTPPGSVWSSTSQTVASVRQHQDRWTVAFISRSSSVSAEALAKAFSNCVPTHDPAIGIEVESQWFFDLR